MKKNYDDAERKQRSLIEGSYEISDMIEKLRLTLAATPDTQLDWLTLRDWCFDEYQELVKRYPLLGGIVPWPFLTEEGWWYKDLLGHCQETDRETMAEYRHEYSWYAPMCTGISLKKLGPTGWRKGLPMCSTNATAYLSFAYDTRQRFQRLLDDLKGVNTRWETEQANG